MRPAACVFLLLCIVVLKGASSLPSLPEQSGISSRVMGGTNVNISNRKFQLAVYTTTNLCGGVLIKANWLLTAAHCTE